MTVASHMLAELIYACRVLRCPSVRVLMIIAVKRKGTISEAGSRWTAN